MPLRSLWISSFSVVGVAVLLAVIAPSNRADGYCLANNLPDPVSWTSIPVRLHADLDDQMLHADGTAWTRSELERAVRLTLARLNQSAGADVPHMYLDTSATPSTCAWFDANCDFSPNPDVTCTLPGVIHVVPDNCGASRFWPDSNVLHIQRTNPADPMRDKRYGHYSGGGAIFEFVLSHELGHALGLDHANTAASWSSVCPAPDNITGPCALMSGGEHWLDTRSAEYFMPDDRAGLQVLYGPRPEPLERQFESSDLLTGISELGIGNVNAQGFFSASSYPVSSGPTTVTLVGYRRDAAHGSPTVYSWNWSTMALTAEGTPFDHFTNGPFGAAQSSAFRYVVSSTYRMTSDTRRWRRRVTQSIRQIGGSSWSTTQSDPAVGANDDTVAPGISAAYDLQHSRLLLAFRSSNGRIVLQAGTGGPILTTAWRSEGPPSIACAPASGLNCIVVSVEPGRPVTTSTAPRLRWFRFSYDTLTDWTIGPLVTEPWVMHHGDPQAAVYWNGSAFDFAVTLTHEVNTQHYAYVLSMNAAVGTAFTFHGAFVSSTDLYTHFVANGSTRDLEMFRFRQ